MDLDRRSILLMGVIGLAADLSGPFKPASAQGVVTEGVSPAPWPAQDMASNIINSLPTSDYVQVMEALANLDKSAPMGPDGKPYNQRWPIHANPLLVRMWHDVGYTHVASDCLSWCGVAIGWCLQRTGHAIPSDCASSQNYLEYGAPVFSPASGDLAVFTDYGKAGSGHVTIFRRWIDSHTIEVLGGNQQLSGETNCPSGFPVSVIDERPMSVDSRHVHPDGSVSGKYLNQFVRPPVPTSLPVTHSGPAIF